MSRFHWNEKIRPFAGGVRPELSNHVSTLFANHDGGCVGVGSNDCWHDRGIHHSQPSHASHSATRIF